MAGAYDELVMPMTSLYAQEALQAVGVVPGTRVLDVACGSGALAIMAARAGADVLATDFSQAMVDRVRRHAKQEELDHLRAQVMDAQHLTLPDDSFDTVFCVFGAMFFPDRVQGFREMHRVLRPDGRVVVVTWSQADRQDFYRMFMRALQRVVPNLPPPPRPPTPFNLADPGLLEKELREAGFRSVRVQTVARETSIPTPELAWDLVHKTNPVFPTIIAQLGEENVPRVRDALIQDLRARYGNDPVPLRGEAHVAVAHK